MEEEMVGLSERSGRYFDEALPAIWKPTGMYHAKLGSFASILPGATQRMQMQV
jgi:hypothetical protein